MAEVNTVQQGQYNNGLTKNISLREQTPKTETDLYSAGGATVPVKRDLRSTNFKDGVRGWRLRSNGDVDFPALSVGGINQIDGGSSIGSFGSIAAVDGGDATTVF